MKSSIIGCRKLVGELRYFNATVGAGFILQLTPHDLFGNISQSVERYLLTQL
jgi:cold shock CspA family protein